MEQNQILYLVMRMDENVDIVIDELQVKEVNLCYGDGMVGAMPVFDDYEKAEAFADGRFDIVPIRIKRSAKRNDKKN